MASAIRFGVFLACVAGSLSCAPLAFAASSQIDLEFDADKDGSLNVEEFVMALGEREYGRRDTNKDNVISKSEWLANGGDFQQLTYDRFNADADDVMSAQELVEVFVWIFSNRDKNKDGKLDPSEAPPYLLAK
jgi:hypothetical protein